MVSQSTMRRTLVLCTCLSGLMVFLFLFAACGQNEGGRCQVDSDCGSGLTCKNGTSGNGTCRYPASANTDAALTSDLADDVALSLGPEVGIDVVVTTERDADTLDTAAVTLDAGAVDSGSLDSTGLD